MNPASHSREPGPVPLSYPAIIHTPSVYIIIENVKTRLQLQKVSQFSLAQNPDPYCVACYVPGVKGQPSIVRVSPEARAPVFLQQ